MMKIYRQFMRLGRGDANTSTLLFNQFCVQGGQRWYQRKTRHEFKPNVGLRNTMKMLRNENKTVNNLDNVEDDDDYDFDDEVFHANKTYDQHMAEQEKRHKITTLKIIEKKYFKKPKEPNLLTWTAKEQLKYLNSMDPGLWTPEKLAESFPISVEGVKKLLKSNFRPNNEQQLLRHDKSVLANWKILKSDQGPISTTLTPLLLNFENLDGNRRLPMPKLKMKWVDRKEEFDSTAPVGEFEGLIKDHKELMKKSCQKDNVSNTCTYSDENEIDNKLQQLSPTNKNSSRLVSFEEFKQSMRQQVLQTSNNNSLAQKYLDLMEDTANTTTSISSETDDPSSDDDDIKDFFDGRIEKYKKPQKLNIKWDIHRDAKTSYEKEAYLYDEEKGYERPYGKYYEFQKIDIPESLKRSNSIYRKGECYYDENGQLLYRVPFSGNHDA